MRYQCSEVAMTKESATRNSQKDLPGSSQLLLLRVWVNRKKASQEPDDLAGRVQDPVTGQVRYFRGGMDLVRLLRRLILREDTVPDNAADEP